MAITRQPISSFYAANVETTGTASAILTMAPPGAANPPSTPNYKPYSVIQAITVALAGGTGSSNPITVSLIDLAGTTTAWAATLGVNTKSKAGEAISGLSIPIFGTAQLAFGTSGGAGTTQSVAWSGYTMNYGDV